MIKSFAFGQSTHYGKKQKMAFFMPEIILVYSCYFDTFKLLASFHPKNDFAVLMAYAICFRILDLYILARSCIIHFQSLYNYYLMPMFSEVTSFPFAFCKWFLFILSFLCADIFSQTKSFLKPSFCHCLHSELHFAVRHCQQ